MSQATDCIEPAQQAPPPEDKSHSNTKENDYQTHTGASDTNETDPQDSHNPAAFPLGSESTTEAQDATQRAHCILRPHFLPPIQREMHPTSQPRSQSPSMSHIPPQQQQQQQQHDQDEDQSQYQSQNPNLLGPFHLAVSFQMQYRPHEQSNLRSHYPAALDPRIHSSTYALPLGSYHPLQAAFSGRPVATGLENSMPSQSYYSSETQLPNQPDDASTYAHMISPPYEPYAARGGRRMYMSGSESSEKSDGDLMPRPVENALVHKPTIPTENQKQNIAVGSDVGMNARHQPYSEGGALQTVDAETSQMPRRGRVSFAEKDTVLQAKPVPRFIEDDCPNRSDDKWRKWRAVDYDDGEREDRCLGIVFTITGLFLCLPCLSLCEA